MMRGIFLAFLLLIPAASRLLELGEVQALVEPFDQRALAYPWRHPDPSMDALQSEVMRAVHRAQRAGEGRAAIFGRVWALAHGAPYEPVEVLARSLIPQMSEPWYC